MRSLQFNSDNSNLKSKEGRESEKQRIAVKDFQNVCHKLSHLVICEQITQVRARYPESRQDQATSYLPQPFIFNL